MGTPIIRSRTFLLLGFAAVGSLVMLGPAASSRTSSARSLPARNGRFTLARVDRCFFAPPPSGVTGWPLAPTGRAHGIRGSFNGVRGAAPHFGVDVEALRNQAPVYAVAAGSVLRVRQRAHRFSIRTLANGHNLFYDHVVPVPTLHTNEPIDAGELVGHVVKGYYHVHVSEHTAACDAALPLDAAWRRRPAS